MSYTIELYSREFLSRAMAKQSGNWADANALSMTSVEGIVNACVVEGFVAKQHPPGFEDYLRQQGVIPSRDLRQHGSNVSAQVSIFTGSVSFIVENSPVALTSIEFCRTLARNLAEKFDLGYYDGQSGEAVL